MLSQVALQSVLIVSSSAKPIEFIKEVLPRSEFGLILTASTASEAKRIMIESPVDIVIINSPLMDDSGIHLAVDTVTSSLAGVLMLVKPDIYESVSYKMEPYGVLTLTKALNKQILYQTIKLLSATSNKMRKLEESAATLEKKLREMKTINKAKGILIEHLKMSEEDAHKYIEKEAMDNCVKKIEIAKQIIEKYEF